MTNKESQTVEYKQTWRNDCLKAVSAFANSDGGVLIIGLDDRGKPSGLKNAKKLLEDIPNTIRIGKFLSDTEIQTTDIVKGNLFAQLESALEILRTKYLLSEIRYEGIHRRDILEYPYEALREAIINALIHRDYSGTSQIQIRVYPDKLMIMNKANYRRKFQ